ncbi:MAG: aminoacyl-tRNA hydrolase [Gammaproteobacteria bacterium RIFCSPHIGHO2_12_FULL_35_23]|nr:MAG: aminoacyl-tRNA hydrolase [Gammaproteobacteria bacterium RIFCSPHIGHO2_12_FULL_35_23]
MTQAIRLIVGLGNPGSNYATTRHNAGVWFIEQLINRYKGELRGEKKLKGQLAKIILQDNEYLILVPSTFMNLSGESVIATMNFYKILPEQLLVAHDELDLPVGAIRIKQAGGHGGHNGLRSIISSIGNNFFRLRIGIGRPLDNQQVADYVLQPPKNSEQNEIHTAITQALIALPDLLTGNTQRAMHALHTDTKQEE